MSKIRRDKYDDFLEKLDAGFFRTKVSAVKSVSRRKLTQEQKAALTKHINIKFGADEPVPPRPVLASSFEEFLQSAGAAAKTFKDVAHSHLAYMAFLREAIQTNVAVANGLKALKDIAADVDTTECQDVVNRLVILHQRYNDELVRVLAIVDKQALE